MSTPESTSAVRHPEWLTNRQLLILDTTLLLVAWGSAWTLRFEGLSWLVTWREAATNHALVSIALWLGVSASFGLYRRVWATASVEELEALLVTLGVAAAVNVVAGVFLLPLTGLAHTRLPLSVISSQTMWSMAFLALPRVCARLVRWHSARSRPRSQGKRVLILGAGNAGRSTAREMIEQPHLGYQPIGFLDDSPALRDHRVAGLPVFGPIATLADSLQKHEVRNVILAIEDATGTMVREIVRVCTDAGAEARTVPGLAEVLSGRVGVNQLRPVEIQDLLRRAPVETDLGAVRRIAEGRTVMITGAGGSIGGELCRQIARHAPSRLVLLGHGENSIYEIHHELLTRFPNVPLATVIADIRDEARIDSVMAQYTPHAVFHAAAHKHVPLMEENLVEAITNNVKGTRVMVEAAARYGVPYFVLISSDKAVNPTSIMGATKRIAELIVQRTAANAGLNYVCVRFGNVLGSRGSVVPMFLRQIRAGGPVMITHPDMTRYFMTIPEAVQLVLQAAVLGKGGEVMVLEMGEPVKIVDLASDLIRLSGLRLGTDIEIKFSGIRPGEKLFEELALDHEHMKPTAHEKVLCALIGTPGAGLLHSVDALVAAANKRESDEQLRRRIGELVPEYVALGTTHVVKRELTLVA
jgi:FlaA1/EpsC-like NDP-sugar epimerase